MKTKKITWGLNSYEFYKPNKNIIKLSLVSAFIILCLVTPFTNWLMIPMFKVLNKFPIWLYK